MSTTLKRTIMILFVPLFLEVFTFFSLAVASQNQAIAEVGDSSITTLEASEALFTPPVEPAPEPEPVEEAITDDSEAIVISAEEDYPIEPYQEEVYSYATNGIYIPAGTTVSATDFAYNGSYRDDEFSYTYYSENVRPGGDLDIPGRHVDSEGYVCDVNGNICIASDDLAKGTVVNVPFGSGTAVVYDCGSGNGNLDIYTSW